jgi:four helix bundle protein
MQVVKRVYEATDRFPRQEIYGLASQMQRAAVSVVSNIAEGAGRFSDREFKHFLSQARGSLFELETQILIAEERQYLTDTLTRDLLRRTEEISRMLSGLRESIRPRAGDAPPEMPASSRAKASSKTHNSQLATHNS